MTKKGRKSILLFLGLFFLWVIALPIMLVRFLYKKGILSKKIAIIIGVVLSLIWFPVILSQSDSNEEGSRSAGKQFEEKTVENNTTIKKLSFSENEDITVRVGETTKKSYSDYIDVSMKSWGDKLNPNDILLISENPEIATITYLDKSSLFIYYSITGISAGETFIYASSVDGSVVSEKVRVIVPVPIEAERIDVVAERNDLAIGEIVKTSVTIQPENTDYKTITWISSDERIATINEKGEITAISDGVSTITASLANGLSTSFDIHVDGTKQLMRLAVTYSREDNLNIGDEWDYDWTLNGEWPPKTISLSEKDKLAFYAKFVEEDDKPDIGEAKKSYTVKKDDLANGFEISLDVKVRENGGKNRGQTAHFIVTFTFTPA